MSNDGKYVRPVDPTSVEEDNTTSIDDESADQTNDEFSSSPDSSSSNTDSSCSSDCEIDIGENQDEVTPHDSEASALPHSPSVSRAMAETGTVINLTSDAVEQTTHAERIERMEKMLSGINETLSRFNETLSRPTVSNNPVSDDSWNISNQASSGTNNGGSSSTNIRWDHIKPFPSGIVANKMWEEWNRYVENFELAVLLSNLNDPVKRTQLLYLSVGSELQEIIKAAKLRPSLTNPDCYQVFVSNIKSYFRSMTDTAAEHEAFSRMKQENGEAAVAFHARLMSKVRSCNYSVDDEDRFVRAQLLSGLRNRELVKQARIYGYETNFIVLSATRDEAFAAETHQSEGSGVFEVRKLHRASPYDQDNRRPTNSGNRADRPLRGPPIRHHRGGMSNHKPQEQRQRCTRCFLFSHRNGQCPALSRNCNKCGKRGHFVAACRQKQVNLMQQRSDNSMERFTSPIEEKYDEDKQVLNRQ